MIRHLKRAAILGLTLAASPPQLSPRPRLKNRPALRLEARAGGADMSCSGDKVVWFNTKSGIYHFKGERWFGNTQQGKYMCEHAADAEGDRPTHNGQ